MRRPLIAANWKMQKTTVEASAFAAELRRLLVPPAEVDIVIAPPFTALAALRDALGDAPVALGVQNVHPEPSGAFTGEISVGMLVDLGCRYAILGHSERRALFGETSEFVARKLAAVIGAGLYPIVCVGETLEEREAGRTFDVIGAQLEASLATLPQERAADCAVAYEPVWAIGTGRTATPEIAQEAHACIREQLAKRFGEAAREMRILYGGSVKPENAAALLAQPDIDGALVGGASLDPASLCAIIRFDARLEEGPR